MKASIPVKLKPFSVPNYVLVDGPPRPRQEGFTEAPKYAIHELSVEDLEALCDQFRRDVLEKHARGQTND